MKTLARDENGDLALPVRLNTGIDAVLQKVRARLRFFLGEWFLDQRLGVPYYSRILVKNPNLSPVSSIYRRVISKTRWIHSVKFVRVRLDKPNRIAYVSFEATTTEGARLALDSEPFIIN